MDREKKQQLILSGILLCFIISTLWMQYSNFVFHTYVNVADYQYVCSGENEEFMIDGFQLYKYEDTYYYSGARLLAIENDLLRKGDQIDLTLSLQDKDKQSLHQKYIVKADNEVCYLGVEKVDDMIDQQQKIECQIQITRQKKQVYNKKITMDVEEMTVYNGWNKDYTLQNVYVTDTWLKTGIFSTTNENLGEEYPYMILDYLCLENGGNETDLNDYLPLAHISGKTNDIIKRKPISAYYDEEGSLLERPICCVVTLLKNEKDQEGYTFKIDLQGNMKVGDTNGK